MQITANQISDWATRKEAQALLPRLIRKLIHAVGTPTEIDFPAGDSTNLPGWDGEVMSDHGSAWVPKGKSFWEVSCETRVTAKANRDYEKRTNETSVTARKNTTIIIVTARKWSTKRKWIESKQKAGEWEEIQAYDANDLEQWLEQSPPVALQFSEELGLIGDGVESVERHWESWSRQKIGRAHV